MYSTQTNKTLIAFLCVFLVEATSARRRLWNLRAIVSKVTGKSTTNPDVWENRYNKLFYKIDENGVKTEEEQTFTFSTVKARNSLVSVAKHTLPAATGFGGLGMLGGAAGAATTVIGAIGKGVAPRHSAEVKYTFTFRIHEKEDGTKQMLVKLEQVKGNMIGYKQDAQYAVLKRITAPSKSVYHKVPRVKFIFKTLTFEPVCDRWIYGIAGGEMESLMRRFWGALEANEHLKLDIKDPTKSGRIDRLGSLFGNTKNCINFNGENRSRMTVDRYLEYCKNPDVQQAELIIKELKDKNCRQEAALEATHEGRKMKKIMNKLTTLQKRLSKLTGTPIAQLK